MHRRRGLESDAELVLQVLACAADWRLEQARSVDQVLSDPAVAKYGAGWPRHGDAGVVAELGEGEAVGAAWWRHFNSAEPGYGFVSAAVPELTLGVLPPYRRQGAGRLLMRGLVELGREQGLQAVSLSVEHDNPALRLYLSLGFVRVGGSEDAPTLLRELVP